MSSPEMDLAREAAQAGGQIIARYARDGGHGLEGKDQTYNLVTKADIESERAIVAHIRQRFPTHAILAEEEAEADPTAEHLWVVDPLDGTNNFAHGLPQCAVSIAYYRAGVPTVGVIHNPILGDWYTAQRGQGAFHNGKPAHVGPQTQLNEVLVGLGFFYDRGVMMEATLSCIRDLFTRHVHGVRRIAPASVDLCHVGLGRFGAFFEYELAPWDHAAARLFVEEAGGKVTTCRGEPLTLQRSSVLASNGPLHATVLEIVESHFPPGWTH